MNRGSGSESQLQAETMDALHEVAVAAGGVTDQVLLAQLVVERARLIAGGDAAVLRWFESDTSTFRLLASVGTRPGPQEGPQEDVAIGAQTAISTAFKTRQPVVVNDYQASKQTTSWGRRTRIRAQVAVPLLVEGRPVGTLVVLSYDEHVYEPNDARFLSLVAAIVAPALEAARLTKEVRRQAQSRSQIYEALPVMVVVYGRDGIAIQHNSAAEVALGPERLDAVRGRRIELYGEDGAVIADEDRPFAQAMRKKAPVRGIVVAFGSEPRRWAYMDAVPLLDDQGEVEAVVTSSIEITALKAAEARERQHASQLRKLIDVQTELGNPGLGVEQVMNLVAQRTVEVTGAPGAAVQVLDGDEVVIAAAAGFGRELQGIRFPTKGNPITGCIADGEAQETKDAWVDPRCDQRAAHVTGIRSLVMAPIRWEGKVLGGLQLQSPEPDALLGGEIALGLLAGFAGAAISRARSASALRTSEQLSTGAFQASGIGMALTQLNGAVIRANPALCELLGFEETELAGMDARQLVAADDLSQVVETLAGLYVHADPAVLSTNLRVTHKEGHAIWVRLTASLIRVDDKPRNVLLHLVDVTEERKAEAILKSELERLGEIVEAQRDIAGNELDIDRLLGVLAERTVRLTGATSVSVMLPVDRNLVVRATAGVPKIPLGYAVPIDQSLAGLAFRTRRLQQAADAKNDARTHGPTATGAGIGAIVAAPLVRGGEVIGVLLLVSREARALDEVDARTVEMIAGFTAAAFERASTTRRLKASEQRIRAVVEAAPYPIVMFDAAGQIVDFNPAAEKAFLRPHEEAVGLPASILLAPKHADAMARWLRDGRSAGSNEYAGTRFESMGRRSDGTEFPIEIAVANLPEETQLAAAFLRDLTMRERLKESSARLAAVVSGAPVILLACDAAGTVTLAEGRGLSLLGLTPLEAVGRNVRDLVDRQAEALQLLDRAINGETLSGLLHLTRPDVYFESAMSPITNPEGVTLGVSVVLADVTDRARADAAQRESEAKSRLMAMMNHEVRTPLNSILGFAHLMTDPRVGELNEKQRHYLGNIQLSGNHLLALVNDSLDLAKLDAGRIAVKLEDLPVRGVMEKAVEQVRPLAEARGLSLSIQSAAAITARGDARQLDQVLLNLLANAIRHTPAGGSVTLSTRLEGDLVAISVIDTGEGIAPEDQPRLFEEFFQAGNHAPGGIGLGLAISRRLVQVMGGSISFESKLGSGSTFTVRLPAGKDEAA